MNLNRIEKALPVLLLALTAVVLVGVLTCTRLLMMSRVGAEGGAGSVTGQSGNHSAQLQASGPVLSGAHAPAMIPYMVRAPRPVSSTSTLVTLV